MFSTLISLSRNVFRHKKNDENKSYDRFIDNDLLSVILSFLPMKEQFATAPLVSWQFYHVSKPLLKSIDYKKIDGEIKTEWMSCKAIKSNRSFIFQKKPVILFYSFLSLMGLRRIYRKGSLFLSDADKFNEIEKFLNPELKNNLFLLTSQQTVNEIMEGIKTKILNKDNSQNIIVSYQPICSNNLSEKHLWFSNLIANKISHYIYNNIRSEIIGVLTMGYKL